MEINVTRADLVQMFSSLKMVNWLGPSAWHGSVSEEKTK